jgi:hypothetical protein
METALRSSSGPANVGGWFGGDRWAVSAFRIAPS